MCLYVVYLPFGEPFGSKEVGGSEESEVSEWMSAVDVESWSEAGRILLCVP